MAASTIAAVKNQASTAHMSTYNALVMASVKAQAESDHARYPQYVGHWDGPEWVLVEITRDVKTKLGLAFVTAERTIGRRSSIPGMVKGVFCEAIEGWTVYSSRNHCDTFLGLNKVQVVAS